MATRQLYAPGDIYVLPPYSTYLDDPDWHRHALLERHQADGSAGLLYGSSKDTLRRQGAACHLIRPEPSNGLQLATYFYGSVLVYAKDSILSNKRGSVGPELANLRKTFRRAMGYRTGSGNMSGGTSLRGMLVQSISQHERDFDTCYFAVLTEHAYSFERQHQIIVPLYNDVDWEVEAPVIDTTPEIRKALRTEARRFSAPGFLVHSIKHGDTVHSELRAYLNAEQLLLIEDGICEALSL